MLHIMRRATTAEVVERLLCASSCAAAGAAHRQNATTTSTNIAQSAANAADVAHAAAPANNTLALPPASINNRINLTNYTVQKVQNVNEPLPAPAAAAATTMAINMFRFEDYDCIGFDLDNTICRYKVSNMVRMEYDALTDYLIAHCGYASTHLKRPIEENVEFMIKGLILDVKKGNVLRIAPSGRILHGSHGTRELAQHELVAYYGAEMRWDVTDVFIRDPLHTWNGPLSETMRALSDYFDMPASLVFARAVDTLDEANGGAPLQEYTIYPHIQEALQDMFQKEHFGASKGGYFPNIKSDPENYIHKCSDALMRWFGELKRAKKTLFLITGSNVDFASHTASQSLGPGWHELFDIVVCFAKKPGFFTQRRPFKALDGFVETHEVAEDDLVQGQIYTAGNWVGVYKFLKRVTHLEQPKVVYIGDHLIQDVYTPSVHTECDAVAVCEELEAEGAFGHDKSHCDENFLLSKVWGSYFHHKEEENIWTDFLRRHAKLAVPSLEYVAKFPIDHQFKSPQ